MTTQQLVEQIHKKQSFLCIGLDSDLEKIPQHLLAEEDPLFAFNKAIIDATHYLCVAYKPNTAFYEAYGIKGWQALEKTIKYLNENYPEIFTIADAKRGDIGNTSTRYAKAFFEELGFAASGPLVWITFFDLFAPKRQVMTGIKVRETNREASRENVTARA